MAIRRRIRMGEGESTSVGRRIQPLQDVQETESGCSFSRRTGEGQGEGHFVEIRLLSDTC
jgi:hypothetical protein